ncbi:hypothetical protein BCV71DRAFT_243653 [Rhizopus microsporus]|uniref:Uncharacterized protein n=1 Tax=Rhizopus microsporus TaxID=58291 RepID=A0A1X0S1B4_RHIZD|nr:hypothetical protein BCV71DRAFT_243653 [Rhizopus microsporus]
MTVGQRKSSIQPRPTKASMLRTQKQSTSSTPSPAELKTPKTTPGSKSTVKSAGPTEGVKAFMAQQRARLATVKQPNGHREEEPQVVPKSSKVMTGAQRYGDSSATEKSTVALRRLDVIIKQAKGSGKLNISSRNLDKIPNEVINMQVYEKDK